MVYDFMFKIMTGFCILFFTFLTGYALWEIESTWPLFLGISLSWLVGHVIFSTGDTTPPQPEFKPETDEDRAKYEEIKKFAETYAAKQNSDVYKYQRAKETEPPFRDHPLLRGTQQYTSYPQQQPKQSGRVSDGFESFILGGAVGYAVGSSHSNHSSGASDSCSSSSSYDSSSYDSGSSSSDSSSCGDD